MNKKATKKQEVKQYPPCYTTSKPIVQADITSTYKPKLNLRHIQQVSQPPSVSPSEKTRKSLSVSSSQSHNIPKQSSHKKARGQMVWKKTDEFGTPRKTCMLRHFVKSATLYNNQILESMPLMM